MTKQGELYGNLVESFVYSELIKHQSWVIPLKIFL
jgi:hypothetical protein